MHAVPWLMQLLAYQTLPSPETHSTFGEQIWLALIDKLFIGLLILGAGFYLNRLLEKWKSAEELRRQHEALRDQTALRYLERQIDELYSPLLGLIQYSNVVFRIARRKVPEGSQSAEQTDVWRYFVEKYFLPLNSQMANLIRTKVSLLESDELPQSFPMLSCPSKIFFPFVCIVLIFCIAGLLFIVLRARLPIGSVSHPAGDRPSHPA